MDLDTLKSLQAQFHKLHITAKREPNIFSIGARGHYENPVSDLLAFFLNPNADHDLKDIVLRALLDCITNGSHLSSSLTTAPKREVITDTGSRLDIVLESETWVMVIENKIWHTQDNPFDSYEDHLDLYYQDKEKVLVVLSPSGESPANWHGISYASFTKNLTGKMSQALIRAPFSKWIILLREYLLHLESLMYISDVPKNTAEYVLNHLDEIQQIQELKVRVIKDLQNQCVNYLEEHFREKGLTITKTIQYWDGGYPALRFGLAHWQNESDVVLYLNGKNDGGCLIYYYACNLQEEGQYQAALNALYQAECNGQWSEASNTAACFSLLLKDRTPSVMFAEVARHLTMLDDFETNTRSQWCHTQQTK
ncbi:MAG: PD-(D/E)XK nuclease family protein [Shewanella sp.]